MSAERESDDDFFVDEEDTLPQPYDEITLTDHAVMRGAPIEDDTPAPPRDIRILDFKDGRSNVTVSHGPIDPSRVWIAFQSPEAYLHLSLEEGIVRRLVDGLGRVLETFAEVRSAIYARGEPR